MAAAVRTFIRRFIRSIVAPHYRAISLASILVTLAAIGIIAATWNIDSDLSAMLAPESDAAKAMEEVDARVGAGGGLYVVITSSDTEANKEFAGEFARRLRKLDAVSLAHFHNDKTFFEKHQLLYLPAEDLAKVRARIEAEIREAKKRANPFFVSLDSDDETDGATDERSLESLERERDYVFDRHKEYLVSDDGYSLTMVVQFDRVASDMAATEELLDRVRRIGEQLDPSSYHADMSFELGGALVSRQNTYQSILDDVRLSAVATLLALFLVISLYFRRVRAVFLILSPLVMGVVWTLAVAFVLFGALTTVSAFIFAILLGLGIDFSIHLLSSYDSHRADGAEPVDALASCYAGTGRATVIGATTTFITFLVISFAEFRGLGQFGRVASLGIAATLAAILVALPAWILQLHEWWPHDAHDDRWSLDSPIQSLFLPDRIRRWAPAALVAVAAATGVAVMQFDQLEFRQNFRRIGEIDWPWERMDAESEEESERDARIRKTRDRARDRAKAIEKSAVSLRKRLDPESFRSRREQTSRGEKIASATQGQRSTAPTMLLFDDADEARRVSRHMRKKKEVGELDTVSSITSIYSFLPGTAEEQRRRQAELAKIRALLDREDLSVLGDDERAMVRRLRSKLDVSPVDIHDLPDWTKRIFRESGPRGKPPSEGEEFAFEYIIYVVVAVDQHRGGESRRLIRQLERVREETGATFRIASHASILLSLIDEIQGEGLLLIAVALGLVLLFLMIVFGHPLRGLLTLVPLGIGAIWMLGLMGWLGIRFDFFNVIIIPVVIGIGVDDGVHFYRHYRDAGPGLDAIGRTVHLVGAAIVMTSITSSIGFGGLVITEQEGLQSMGHVAITGITTTFIATIAVLPALLWLAERRGWDSVRAHENLDEHESRQGE